MILTFVMLTGIVATVASELIFKTHNKAPVPIGAATPTDGSPDVAGSSEPGGETGTIPSTALDSSPSLVTGMRLEVPTWADLPVLKEIPWSRTEAASAYREAQNRACRLLADDMDVGPPMALPSATARPLGRAPAFTIGLEVDPAARASLPGPSKKMIEDYLYDHRLVVEAPIYSDAQATPFLGTDVKAACFTRDNPYRSMKPEAMIESAVSELKILGAYRAPDDLSETPPTTLVLLFRYSVLEKDLVTGAAGAPVQEYELLFLHLFKRTPNEKPELVAFSTSEGRKNFHELRPQAHTAPTSSITAQIRFGEFTTLGLYPASPMVVDVNVAARFTVPVETVRARLQSSDQQPATTLPALLDELHATPPATTDP